MKRISMWSGPRNVSTAIMYAFHHRGDCHVIDEPFYAHYLKTTGLDHPGRDKTLEVHESNAEMVITSLVNGRYDKDVLFMKNMPHHMVGVDISFITAFDNFFLIREPRAMISSYIKKIPDVSMSDLGLDVQFNMYDILMKQGYRAPVIDSYDLLREPKSVLELLCSEMGIPFKSSMTNWNAGPIAQDGAWAEFWYANVHASTGLGYPKEPGRSKIPPQLENLAQECEEYYYQLKKHELKA